MEDRQNNLDVWKIILFIILDAKHRDELSDEWNKFENEILYKNRFFVKDKLLDEIKNIVKVVTVFMPKDTKLYRARIFDGNATTKLTEKYNDILREKGFPSENIKESELLNIMLTILPAMEEKEIIEYSSLNYWKEALKSYTKGKFKGYNASESLPSKKGGVVGRANPEGISYIYACEDSKTPIYEVRPSIGQSVSLATLRLKKDIKLFDFSRRKEHKNNETTNLFDIICEKFSIPNYNDLNKYIPTQYITEYVKQLGLGFDGIRFDSSLNKGGKNIVLFDRNICSVESTDLVEIKSIDIKTQPPVICQGIKNAIK